MPGGANTSFPVWTKSDKESGEIPKLAHFLSMSVGFNADPLNLSSQILSFYESMLDQQGKRGSAAQSGQNGLAVSWVP